MSSVGILLSTVLLAQGAGVPPDAPSPFPVAQDASETTATLEGVITRVGTGVPIPRAAVSLTPVANADDRAPIVEFLRPGPPPNATTDAGGRFVIEGLAPGAYRVTASRNGFVRQEYGRRQGEPAGIAVVLAAGDILDASFELTPAATVTGRVYDALGEPVAYAHVSAMQTQVLPDGDEAIRSVQTATTDDRGQYRLFWLSPGDYRVSAGTSGARSGNYVSVFALRSTSGFSSITTPNTQPHAEEMTAYHPGVPDAVLATIVSVAPGEERGGVDIELAPGPRFTVSGRVIAPEPIQAFATVSLRPAGPATVLGGRSRYTSSVIDADGGFTVRNVAPGTYTLEARAEAAGERWLEGDVDVEVTNLDIRNLAIPLIAHIDVIGNFFIEDPATQAAAEAVSVLERSRAQVALVDHDGEVAGFGGMRNDDGEFRIGSVAPGAYAVDAPMPNQGLYLKRVMVGLDEVALGDRITIGPGFAEPLYVLLSPNGGRVEGVAANRDGEPVTNALVTLVPIDFGNAALEGLSFASPSRTRTDRNGGYSLTGIAPGEYDLFAWDGTASVRYQDPDFIGRYTGRGERVVVDENDAFELDLEVIPAREVRQAR